MAIRTGDGDTRAGTASGLSDAACTSSHVIDYLREAVPLLLGGTEAQLYDTLIRATELAEQFVSDPATPAICVHRYTGEPEQGKDEDARDGAMPPYIVDTNVSFSNDKYATAGFVKRNKDLPLVHDKPLPTQLHIGVLADGAPFGTLQVMMQQFLAPYFHSAVKVLNASEKDGVKPTQKAVVDLETLLTHLQQDTDIPQIELVVDRSITEAVSKAKAAGRPPTPADLGDLVSDVEFLKSLERGVARWIREIQKVTNLDRDPSSGTARQEISFWLSMERAMQSVMTRSEEADVALTLETLRAANRPLLPMRFSSDTNLQKFEIVTSYNTLMKDFPINLLLTATDLDAIQDALTEIFQHMKRIKHTRYPVERAQQLELAISRDLNDQLLKVLRSHSLMHISVADFEKIYTQCNKIERTWTEQSGTLRQMLREIQQASRVKTKTVKKLEFKHQPLMDKLLLLRKFRFEHNQLASVIAKVLRPRVEEGGEESSDLMNEDDLDAIEEVKLAYDEMKAVDILDLSEQGSQAWEIAKKNYDERIDRVEETIIARLRDQLGQAKSSAEMFRIFKRFNVLFVRQRIRGAIRAYQRQLIARVKEDIKALHTKFKVQYQRSNNSVMSDVRDIPPISGQIIWTRQIERQLDEYLQRVEDVLGQGWENHVEGRELREDGDFFKNKLHRANPYVQWVAETDSKHISLGGTIFDIELYRGETTRLEIFVNFHDHLITMAKEVRNLKWLGHRVPISIVQKAREANNLYPYVISLKASIKTYTQTVDKLATRPHLRPIVASWYSNVQSRIATGMRLTWKDALDSYSYTLAHETLDFQDHVGDAFGFDDTISEVLESLSTCEYSARAFGSLLHRAQATIDLMREKRFINLRTWVANVNARFEQKLLGRLQQALALWVKALSRLQRERRADWDEDAEAEDDDLPTIRTSTHELQLHAQTMTLKPPIERARADLFRLLQDHVNIVVNQTALHAHALPTADAATNAIAAEGGVALVARAKGLSTYASLLRRLPNDGADLAEAYGLIESQMDKMTQYVQSWLQYQALWDLQVDSVYARLGDDFEAWQALLVDIKRSRQHIDTAETVRRFGSAEIDYAQVQARVAMKYDAINRDILGQFASKLDTGINRFYSEVNKAREKLESMAMEGAHTSDSIAYIGLIQSNKKRVPHLTAQFEAYASGEKLLERQRYPFPGDWLRIEQVEGEWEAFRSILNRRDASVSGQVANLQMSVVNEERQLETQLAALVVDWDKNKPMGGDTNPDEAVNLLNIFEGRFMRLKDDQDNLIRAKTALDLDVKDDVRLATRIDELHELKSSWAELSRVVSKMSELKGTEWGAVVPSKVRSTLNKIIEEMKTMPARVKSYEAYEHMLEQSRAYLKVNETIAVLRGDALKSRHWKMLTRNLNVNWDMAILTLGQVWAVDLKANEQAVNEVLLQAQGEKALEEFLKQIKETWQSYELELVNYQNKTKLIKGWDDLFTQAKDHITNLAQMKMSPYYKVFEEEATAWDQKLNMLYTLFCDVWIDVQRQWVYLDGIFTGSADLKVLLPTETNKFTSLSSEFVGLMRKVSKNPLVLEVLTLANLQRTLEHLKDVLDKIQKALSKYLEQERASFPRFYFVGDEDLLDIIGNGKNVERIQKHFRKMFAGVTSIQIDEEGTVCNGVASKEGEEVPYREQVIIKDRKINAWLTALEEQMKLSLASLLGDSVAAVDAFRTGGFELEPYLAWLDRFQAQLVTLSAQVSWSESARLALHAMESGARGGGQLQALVESVETTLTGLADTVLQHQPPIRRKKLEQVITELVHKRDLTREFPRNGISSTADFGWLQYMRFQYAPGEADVLQRFTIHMADTVFHYGYEYLGLVDKLVQTPLTDRCYLTMTQALAARQGGSPFGPAGTGKTESVKALGAQLGRFVLVFNCDETFDNHAMGRIFVGLCQVGAWGCFDEFNRLEESMLSAVSQQIESIQLAIKAGAGLEPEAARRAMTVSLQGRAVGVNPDMAIFITMNPGYAGRSPLPDNLKKLFRNLAMTKPDRQLIAQVMLYSQGFRSAEALSRKVVPLFILCEEQLSAQSHYDFGLRSLKAVLVSAGNIKRDRLAAARKAMTDAGQEIDETAVAASIDEQEVVIQSMTQTMIPKLVAQDIPLLNSLLADVFPGVEPPEIPLDDLRACIVEICNERHLLLGDMWLNKVLQLYQVTTLNHGLMMVGPSGSGKSAAWRVLLDALQRLEKKEAESYVLDPKAITKDELYGFLDPTTREWTDGLFTHIIRKIIDNVRGERNKRQWIIFDGDVDPEWVENLNSVLDDNKLLTLPNGERLSLPPCIRILFEVQDLKHATLATVSRCGMVWFSAEVLSLDMYYDHFLRRMRHQPLGEAEATVNAPGGGGGGAALAVGDDGAGGGLSLGGGSLTEGDRRGALVLQNQIADVLAPFFEADGLVTRALDHASTLFHVMEFTSVRCLNALFSMLNQVARTLSEYNAAHPDFLLTEGQVVSYTGKRFVYALLWSLVGDSRGSVRKQMSDFVRASITMDLPAPELGDIIDFEVTLPAGEWQPWTLKVPRIEIETERVAGTDVVVPTLDTVRHEDLLYSWLSEHLPIVLCGPPGSGKTMTLFSALRALPHFEVAGLNFSSTTTPELIMKTFDQYCEYRRSANGVVLAPAQVNKWLVVFMDECNLPAQDKYATVRVITFIRQLVEQGGFWRTADHTWVRLERIQFVGACNPPTDPGRVPLMQRFLRHVPVVYVDYPGPESLKQIYGTFNRAVLRTHPALERYGDALTDAMVDFYSQSQVRFTADMQPHYIYSPREMTRWVKGVAEAISPLAASGTPLSVGGLVRVWAHEALRLFQDRLVHEEERRWTDAKIDEVAGIHFPGADLPAALARPILFSDWLTQLYEPVDLEKLRVFVHDKLHSFTEEQLDVQLVLFDEVLDHVLRIDRVFRQNQGHMLLIGTSGCGRTTLSRFVAWMNDLSVVQIKAHSQYTADDFDVDLRDVLRRSGVEGERIVFILDEGNVMDTAFLERMNTLLANGEVPGLFEGDEYAALMTKCKEASRRAGQHLDDNDELYRWFSRNVMDNLHIVFTMCPSESGMQDRASTSPALFNRCVLDWFGDWPDTALLHVAREFTENVDLERAGYEPPMDFPLAVLGKLPEAPSFRDAVHNAAVYFHQSAKNAVRRLQKREGRSTAITPRHFLEFVNQFTTFLHEKRTALEEQKNHLLSGVVKIEETRDTVESLQGTLTEKRAQLEAKSIAAKEKLNLILGEKQAANEKKEESLRIEKELQAKQSLAAERKAGVEQELAGVAPLVEEAKQAVQGIGKKELQEIRALANPPQAVKAALEGALTLMGKHTKDWKAIRSIIAQESFTAEVLKFDSNTISKKSMGIMEKTYLNDPLFTYEKANRASRAAGPLVKWALAQMAYANQLLKVEPLNNELRELEAAADEMRQQQDAIQVLVGELEEKIQLYEQEYAVLISEQEAIKADLNTVTEKVQRSEKLLTDLASEKERWSHGAEDFDSQMATLVGDCLLAAAFMGYGGYFDQRYRRLLLGWWTTHISKARVQYKPGMEDGIPEYLSAPDDRMRWKVNGLPDDELCVQNALMLKRSLRTPLVIDPAGQAAQFIIKESNRDGKLLVSSFLNPGQLRKDLESALRFGTTLFVQDAEAFDPLLNPVLNNEVQRKGGRVFVNVAGKDIDLSPSFSMILITRNPGVEFPVDLCSRVTLINFTVTRGSLMTQCLNQALRCERPDVDEQRADLLRMQGEFRLKLLNLENALLDALNKAQGSILDDNKVISHLETLKTEAMEVQQKVNETDTIMATVEKVSREYQPLAQRCSAIYFTLEEMGHLHFLYQFSLHFFLDVFNVVLTANPLLEGVTDHARRLEVINDTIFRFAFDRVAPGMLHEHRMPLALTFARFRVSGTADEVPAAEMSFFLQGGGVLLGASDFAFLAPAATADQAEGLHHLAASVPAFANMAKEIKQHQADFTQWLAAPRPETAMPAFITGLEGGESNSAVRRAFRELLLLQAARPDRVLSRMHNFVELVLGKGFGSSSTESSLQEVVQTQIKAATPVLLCGVKGFDTSSKVDDLAAATNVSVTPIAVGSADAKREALDVIKSASSSGRWVMLKNVHLAPDLLVTVEKQLAQLTPNPSFRLFLTSEINPKLPSNMVRASRVFLYEAAAGVKASVKRTLHNFPARMESAPTQRGRVYLLLAWMHAVTQERLRYAPLGWSKRYEFGEADLRTAADTIDTWIDRASDNGARELDAADIPWAAIRALLSKSVYGGRVDNEIDQRLLEAFVQTYFSDKSFLPKFTFVAADKASGTPAIKPPEGHTRAALLSWADSLPDAQLPTWLGLPANAETVLLTNRAKALIIDTLKLQTADDDAVEGGGSSAAEAAADAKEAAEAAAAAAEQAAAVAEGGAGASATPAWMRQLSTQAAQWLGILPDALPTLQRTAESIKDPLFRFYEREVNIGATLLADVRQDLSHVLAVCAGEMKQTNRMRDVLATLVQGRVFKAWLRYTVPEGLPVAQWVADFTLRVKQLGEIVAHVGAGKPLGELCVWLGGLFVPEAYITATRQAVAQSNGWALERLMLKLEVPSSSAGKTTAKDAFAVSGLRVEGATLEGQTCRLVDAAFTSHAVTLLRWILNDSDAAATRGDKSGLVNVALYLNTTRANLISVVGFAPEAGVDETVYYRRGVAMMCSSLSGIVA